GWAALRERNEGLTARAQLGPRSDRDRDSPVGPAMLLSTASAAALMLAAHAPQDAVHYAHVTAPDEPAVEVAEVLVTGRRDPMDPAVAARARTQAQETPGAVAVVSREQYADHMAMHLGEALHSVPGVFAEKRWGEEVRLSIRGSGVGNSNHNRGVVL